MYNTLGCNAINVLTVPTLICTLNKIPVGMGWGGVGTREGLDKIFASYIFKKQQIRNIWKGRRLAQMGIKSIIKQKQNSVEQSQDWLLHIILSQQEAQRNRKASPESDPCVCVCVCVCSLIKICGHLNSMGKKPNLSISNVNYHLREKSVHLWVLLVRWLLQIWLGAAKWQQSVHPRNRKLRSSSRAPTPRGLPVGFPIWKTTQSAGTLLPIRLHWVSFTPCPAPFCSQHFSTTPSPQRYPPLVRHPYEHPESYQRSGITLTCFLFSGGSDGSPSYKETNVTFYF